LVVHSINIMIVGFISHVWDSQYLTCLIIEVQLDVTLGMRRTVYQCQFKEPVDVKQYLPLLLSSGALVL
jgi:hypothetical protein